MARRLPWLLLFGLSVACTPRPSLLVQVVSDMAVDREIDGAHVELARASGEVLHTTDTTLTHGVSRATRLGAFAELDEGDYRVTVELRRSGRTIQTRHVARHIVGATVITVLMTRECNGAMCPASDPSAVECLAGRCVAPSCDEEHPELCPMPECTSDASCGAGPVACAPRACSASGACFVRPDDARCGPGQICDVDFGCVAAGTDAGTVDAGSVDAGTVDAGSDAGLDAGSDAGVDASADAAAPRCNRAFPFGAPVLVTELASPSDALTLRLRPGETEGLYWSAGDLFAVTRRSTLVPFVSGPTVGLNDGAAVDLDPSISADGMRAVFSSNRDGNFDLYEAFAMGVGSGTFGTPTPITTANSSSSENQPYLTPSGMYFSSTRAGPSGLYHSTHDASGWSAPVLVAELSSGTNEYDPALTSDELVIYFRSERPGTVRGDVFRAERASVGLPFNPPTRIAELSTDAIDGPSWIADDECVIYLTSDITGTPEIYVARRPL